MKEKTKLFSFRYRCLFAIFFDTGIIEYCTGVIEETPLGRILLSSNVPDACIEDYISDFVHMVYPVKTEDEHKVKL